MEADENAHWGTSPLGPSVSGLSPGDVIADKYRLDAIIGRGGMSVVYRATHLQLEQQFALKVLSAEAIHLPEYVLRLKREARAVSRIRSEHVVRVHDIGELEARPGVPGVPYLVMEYLSGRDLAAVLARRGALPVDLAVECIMQSCEALAEAHGLGIVHRDLKPANLFLTESVDGSPCVKVLDFGISRMARRHGLSSLTDPGTVLGTPSYMAPEQMEAADTLDARSDIWGLGAILHELLVGKPPYGGDSLPQIFIKIMRSRPPKPSLARADVPPALDAIVARCLAIEPSDRFPSVADLAWALSTVGTPRARDSAERISRVFDKRSLEGVASLPEESASPFAFEGSWGRRGSGLRKAAGTFASAAILGAASVFGALAGRDALDGHARAASVMTRPSLNTAALELLVPDAALVIAPATRPNEALARAAAPVPGPAPRVRALTTTAAPHAAPATMVALSLPGRLVVPPDPKQILPDPTSDAPGVTGDSDPQTAPPPIVNPARARPGGGTPSNDVD